MQAKSSFNCNGVQFLNYFSPCNVVVDAAGFSAAVCNTMLSEKKAFVPTAALVGRTKKAPRANQRRSIPKQMDNLTKKK